MCVQTGESYVIAGCGLKMCLNGFVTSFAARDWVQLNTQNVMASKQTTDEHLLLTSPIQGNHAVYGEREEVCSANTRVMYSQHLFPTRAGTFTTQSVRNRQSRSAQTNAMKPSLHQVNAHRKPRSAIEKLSVRPALNFCCCSHNWSSELTHVSKYVQAGQV